MAQTVVVNGVNYTIPDVNEEDWGQNVTDYLVALAVIGSLTQSFMNYVSVTTTPVTIVSGRTYLVDTSVARTLNLPAAALNAFFLVRDKTGSAATNNITIARAGTESIDGTAANKTLSINKGFWMFMCDGTDWWQISLQDAYIDKYATALTPATPAAVSSSLTDRLAMIVYQLKAITGLTNWYDVPAVAAVSSSGNMGTNLTEFVDATSADITRTLPTAVGCSGRVYRVKKTDSGGNSVIVNTTSSQTIDGALEYTLSVQYECLTVVSDGANWQILSKF
jgi:hypothetical protein